MWLDSMSASLDYIQGKAYKKLHLLQKLDCPPDGIDNILHEFLILVQYHQIKL